MKTVEVKEIAKQVKKDLKASYPSVKFTVKHDGNSITVKYMDGVQQPLIQSIVEKYRGYRDLADTYGDYGDDVEPVSIVFQGERVESRLKNIDVTRLFSPQYLTEVLEYVKENHGDSVGANAVVSLSDYAENALFDGDFEGQAYCLQIAKSCSSLEPIKVQCDR
jgi:hypothetical protein